MKNTVTLSQCMIVKNEEKNIEKALSWGKGIVCEQIVVDTGSTDRTVEIAESMGARVYHFQWIDDFSAAKNFAIEKASGDWIAFLDADEYFLEEEAKKILPILQNLQNRSCHALVTGWLQLNSAGKIFAGGAMARIFKNIPGLRYRNRVHEELYLNGKKPVYIDGSKELAIFHTGYSGTAHDELNKGKRNLPLIIKELEDHPDDYNMMGFLGDCYALMGDDDEAARWFAKAVELMPDKLDESDGRSATTLLKLMSIYMKQENDEKAEILYRRAIALLPQKPDFDFLLGQYYARKQAYEKGAYYLKRSLEMVERFGGANTGMLLLGKLPLAWELLAQCHYENGHLGDCVNCTVALLKGNLYMMSVLTLLLQAFMKDEQTGAAAGRRTASSKDVLGFLSKLYDFQQQKDKNFVLEAAQQIHYSGLIQELQNM